MDHRTVSLRYNLQNTAKLIRLGTQNPFHRLLRSNIGSNWEVHKRTYLIVKERNSPRSHVSERYTVFNRGPAGNSRLFTIQKKVITQGVHKGMVWFQKLTRNLFLTLHGHSVHRQQHQLSRFLMCYQQFASHAYCGASFQDGVSQQEKAFCVLHFEVSRSVITVQRVFRKDAPCMVRLF